MNFQLIPSTSTQTCGRGRRFADWQLQSQREEEPYSVSRTSKRGADFVFEFQTDPVHELVEVRRGVHAQVEVRGRYSSKGPISPNRRKLTQEQRASRGADFDFEFGSDPVDDLVDVWKGQACREE